MTDPIAEVRNTITAAVNCVSDQMPGAEGAKCIGFLLVAELMDEAGCRNIHVLSGDASGGPLVECIGYAYSCAAMAAYESDE